MHATFLDTSVLVCVPTLVFATSFALSLDLESGSDLLHREGGVTSIPKVVLGLSLTMSLEYLLTIRYPLYNK
jgi:hypothetical protein